MCCLSEGFHCWDKILWPKATWGRKAFFGLHISAHIPLGEAKVETQGRHLEAGTLAEARRGISYWLAFQSLLSLFSYTAQDYLSMADTHCAGTSHIIIRWCPTGCSTGQVHGGIFSIVVPFPQITLALCQVDKNKSTNQQTKAISKSSHTKMEAPWVRSIKESNWILLRSQKAWRDKGRS